MHPKNVKFIYCTFEVLKLDKFREIKPVHPLNILSKYITDDVSKFNKSKEVKEEQL